MCFGFGYYFLCPCISYHKTKLLLNDCELVNQISKINHRLNEQVESVLLGYRIFSNENVYINRKRQR